MRIEELKGFDTSGLVRHSLTCDNDLQNIPPPLPASDGSHFALIISGKPRSGKSTLALGLLTSKGKNRVYRGRFNHIIIFVPKHSLSSLRTNPFDKLAPEKVFNELTTDNLEKAYEMVKANAENGETTLIFLDDMASSLKQSMKTQELFNKICFNRRHLKTSIMFLVQTFKAIPINCRKTASHIILFKNHNKLENEAVFSEILFLERKIVDLLFKYVYDASHQFLYIDVNSGTLHKNFNPLVIKE